MIQENKYARHYTIRKILESSPIPNQDKLRKELRKHGFEVTQATLSRDLRELGVGRTPSNDGNMYETRQESVRSLAPLIGGEVVSINSNENLIVVITLPGCANTIGEFIDIQKHAGIIGTIAGDNTLLVIPSSVKKIKQVLKFLEKLLFEGKLS